MMVSRECIMDVLRTIPDPEMPISIVDLGLVEDVRVEQNGSDAASPERAHVSVDLLPTFVGCPALDMIARDVHAKISKVTGVERVEVNWIFDPAWSVDRITPAGRESLRQHGVTVPECRWHDAPRREQQHEWRDAPRRDDQQATSDDLSGPRAIDSRTTRSVVPPGVMPPAVVPPFTTLRIDSGGSVPCPFCGSKSTYLDSPFGPTRCRTIHYCESCRNSFEHLKRV